MSDNVFSIVTGKPYEEQIVEDARIEAEEDVKLEKDLQVHLAAMTEMLTKAVNLAKIGRMDGFMMVAKDPVTGLFFTESFLCEPFVSRNDLFAYIGVLETLKAELTDAAAMAPAITSDGVIIDAYQESLAADEYEDYEE